MNKLALAILVLSSTAILADRPDWYPENAAEIEAKCMEKYSINADTFSKIRMTQLEDTPAMRSLLFCSAKAKNIYRPEVGFEVERFYLALKESIKFNCKMDFIRDCAEKCKDLQPEEFMYFSIAKCVFDDMAENCKQIA